MIFELNSSYEMQVSIEKKCYDVDVVYKCFYWYAGLYEVKIDELADVFKVTLNNKEKKIDFEELTTRIKRSLIDFKTRSIIAKETLNIREMLIAKAFAHCDDFDASPPGDINDPVGFDSSVLKV